MSTTIVHLIRHGEVHNPEKILYGRLPGYRLSTRGRNQAARTAASLRGHDVVYLAASPLQRAQETAQPCAHTFNLGIVVDEGLIEAGNQLEGLRVRGWRSNCGTRCAGRCCVIRLCQAGVNITLTLLSA